jgi:hypothetical protein
MDRTIVKKCKNINWKQCQLELFKLQSEILRAFENGDHFLKNLKLLHKHCLKQVEYLKNDNLRATWLKKGYLTAGEKNEIKFQKTFIF